MVGRIACNLEDNLNREKIILAQTKWFISSFYRSKSGLPADIIIFFD